MNDFQQWFWCGNDKTIAAIFSNFQSARFFSKFLQIFFSSKFVKTFISASKALCMNTKYEMIILPCLCKSNWLKSKKCGNFLQFLHFAMKKTIHAGNYILVHGYIEKIKQVIHAWYHTQVHAGNSVTNVTLHLTNKK